MSERAPRSAPAALVQQLSATAGNQAVTRMLRADRLGRTVEVPRSRVLARYGINDTMSTLEAQTVAVGMSGTGNTGALWIEDAAGTRLWIKAQAVPAQRQLFAQDVLERVRVNTPGTRQLTPDEAKQLYGKVFMLGGANTAADKAYDWLAAANRSHHLLMETAPGATPGGAAKKLADPGTPGSEKTALKSHFVRAFKDPEFARSVGRMIAADEFTGNADRISEQSRVDDPSHEPYRIHAHPNNFMVEEDAGRFILTAIDNDAVLEYANDYGDRDLGALIDDVTMGVLADVPRSGGTSSLVFAAGVEGLFDRARTTRMIGHMLKTYRGLAGGDLFAGFTDTDAAAFRKECLAGWDEARAIIMRDLPKIKRRFDELYAQAGGTKNAFDEVPAFEETSFRARKVYSQLRAELDAARADQQTRDYLSAKYAGDDADPFSEVVEDVFADPGGGDPLLGERIGKLRALTATLDKVTAEAYHENAPAIHKLKRLQIRNFLARYPTGAIDTALAAFLPKAGGDAKLITDLRTEVVLLKVVITAASLQHFVRHSQREYAATS